MEYWHTRLLELGEIKSRMPKLGLVLKQKHQEMPGKAGHANFLPDVMSHCRSCAQPTTPCQLLAKKAFLMHWQGYVLIY